MSHITSKILISPSLICCDLCNLESEVRRLEDLGVDSLHIDIIDSVYSPSLPLGMEAVRQLRKKTDLEFDVHLMVNNNELFIKKLIDIGVQRIFIHLESERHIDRALNLIVRNGIKAGIALNPMTPISSIKYCLEYVDSVLLMLINPGFAGLGSETMVSYGKERVRECKQFIKGEQKKASIFVDGRVSFDSIPLLVNAGADALVVGSTSLFDPSESLATNHEKIKA